MFSRKQQDCSIVTEQFGKELSVFYRDDLEIVWKKGKSEESEKYTLTRLNPEKHVGN